MQLTRQVRDAYHITVFPVIGVEQRELLRAVCVGIRIIGIDDDDDGIWLRVIRGDEVIDEGLSDIEQFLAGQAVLQTSHRRLGSKVNLVRSRPAGTHLQDTVTTEPVAIVDIFEAGHGLISQNPESTLVSEFKRDDKSLVPLQQGSRGQERNCAGRVAPGYQINLEKSGLGSIFTR